jgi:hypothetical protein
MVMLIINGDRAMSGAEKVVLARLRASKAPGVAVSGCYVPGRARPGGRAVGQEADVVLFTPAGPVCIEVKGIVKYAASGALACGPNGRWQLTDIEGDPVHVRGNDANPLDQLAGGMYGLKEIAETATGGEVFVPGLVVIVPNKGTITLDKGTIPMPTGRDVILETELAGWLASSARRPPTWTASGVYAVLDRLDLAEGTVTYDALVGAGFSDQPPAPGATVVDLFPATPETDAPQPEPSRASRLAAAPMRGAYSAPASAPARRAVRTRSVVVFAVVACLLAGLAWVFSPGTKPATHDGGSHQSSSVTTAPPAPPAPADPPEESAPRFTAPAKVCYPFQAGC